MTVWAKPGFIRTYRLALPWSCPPLSANHRHHWAPRHRLTSEIRTTTAWLAKQARIPAAEHITVTLVWAPGDLRRRDAVPTLKAACDGLVDAGIVPDDTPAWMKKEMPVVDHPGPARLWLDVEITRPVGSAP